MRSTYSPVSSSYQTRFSEQLDLSYNKIKVQLQELIYLNCQQMNSLLNIKKIAL